MNHYSINTNWGNSHGSQKYNQDCSIRAENEHVNVDLNGEHYDDADDTVQLVRREENEHAIS